MYRIEGIEKIFPEFSPDKSPLSVVHIDKQKGKAGFPFIIQPAASDDGLSGLIIAEPVHDQKKYISFPAVIRLQIIGRDQKDCHGDHLHHLLLLEMLDGAEGQISKKQGEKYILPFISPGIGVHIVPGDFGNTGKQKKIPSIFKTVSGVEKTFHQKKTENGKSQPSDVPAYPVQGIASSKNGKPWLQSGRIHGQQDRGAVVQKHDEDRQHLQGASA